MKRQEAVRFATLYNLFIFDLGSNHFSMHKSFILLSVFWLSFHLAQSQTPKKRLPQNINVPTHSQIFPTLSGDGNQMIYLTDYTNSEGFEPKYSYKTGTETWADPESIESINRPNLDHAGSFCLSYDGNFVVFSSRRSPGIGNYDIWISEKKGNYWTTPQNPGKPLNSPSNEGNPSLSPDGKSIYFMRCKSMDKMNKSECHILVSHRISATRWSEPEVLPDYINVSHETTPRIQADNQTLVFASGRSGGKGKLDLYQTRLSESGWTKPTALDFINTDQNDEYISIPARGDIIYFTGMYRDKYNIFKAMIPETNRPKKVLMLTGEVAYRDNQNPSEDVMIQAFDVATGEVFTTTKLRQTDNSYTIFLPEGAVYDVSAFPQKGGHAYQSQMYDLTAMPISRKEEWEIELDAIRPGLTIPLSTIRYENYSATLTDASNVEIQRIIGFLKKNPGTKLEIGAFIDQVYSDSIQTNDLTEVIADTLFFEVEKDDTLAMEKTYFNDSLDAGQEDFLFEGDSLSEVLTEKNHPDSMDFEGNNFTFEPELSQRDSLYSMGFQLLSDTLNVETFIKIKYTYHNDRTQKQADALMQKLIESGVPANLLEAKGYGDNWTTDRASEERNYWIELKVVGDL